jgi:TonB family protein
LILSLLIHALALFIIFSLKFSYKVFPDKPKAMDVVLSPPIIIGEKIIVPRSQMSSAKTPAGARVEAPIGGAIGRPLSRREASQAKETSSQPSGQEGAAQAEPGFLPIYPELSSKFDLAPSSETKINIIPYSMLKKQKFIDSGKYKELPRIDVSRYSFSGLTGPGGNRTRPGSGRGTGVPGPGQSGSATFNIQGYDISPWATEALNRIQKNWLIPSSQTTTASGKVGISIVIEKTGEISQIEVTLTSEDQWLDQAALEALRSSGPFAKLPADFPLKNLEAYFLFEYGE